MSDIVFLRAWTQVEVPQFYNPLTTALQPRDQTWRGMKTVGEMRREHNLPIPVNKDSLYKVVPCVRQAIALEHCIPSLILSQRISLFLATGASFAMLIYYLVCLLQQPIERKPKKFNPLVIPKSLQAALPFASKPKDIPGRKRPLLENRRAVVMEPHERKVHALVQHLRLIRHEKVGMQSRFPFFFSKFDGGIKRPLI